MLGDVTVKDAFSREFAEWYQDLDPFAWHEVDRIAPGRIAQHRTVPAPDLERPCMQVKYVILSVDVRNLPQREIAELRLDWRKLLLAVRSQEGHRHLEAAADCYRLRVKPLDRSAGSP